MKADCHMHMVLDGVDWRNAIARHADAPLESYIREMLSRYQKQGYTYLRDCGDRWGVGAKARALAPEYGICYRTPLAPLCRKGKYGAFIGRTYEDLKEYRELVVQTREQGGNFIKIMISGLLDFNRFGFLTEEGMEPALIRELIHIAHQEGMAVSAHANGWDVVLAAVEAGVDSIEHGAYQNRESLEAMAQSGTVWVPTLSPAANALGKGRFVEYELEWIVNGMQETVAMYHGLLAPGTDAGAWEVPHGCGTEEALLARAGVDAARLAQGIQVIQEKF